MFLSVIKFSCWLLTQQLYFICHWWKPVNQKQLDSLTRGPSEFLWQDSPFPRSLINLPAFARSHLLP
jgi:hypothetical protein